MSLIEWDSSLSVGIGAMDSEHKKLIVQINNLHAAMLERKSNEVLGNVLSALVDYTRVHFASEEKLMEQNLYPELAMHKKEHEKLVAKVLDIHKRFRFGEKMLSIEVMNFLRDWLTTHINGNDKKYGKFLNAKGIS